MIPISISSEVAFLDHQQRCRSRQMSTARGMELLPTTSVAAHAYSAVVVLDVASWRVGSW